jgi:carbonic anhydrase/acetyltransferase-like protein (isoleucine patch superfamily)
MKTTVSHEQIAETVQIAPQALIGEGTTIEGDVTIAAHAIIGYGCIIHSRVHIAPHAVIGNGVEIHPDVIISQGVTIGTHAIVHEGITLGEGSFIASCSIVSENVLPHRSVLSKRYFTEKPSPFQKLAYTDIYIKVKDIINQLNNEKKTERLTVAEWHHLFEVLNEYKDHLLHHVQHTYNLSFEEMQLCALHLMDVPIKLIEVFFGCSRDTIQRRCRNVVFKMGAPAGTKLKVLLQEIHEKMLNNPPAN